jgi:Tfp pilus assembly pilus retraction ATPase PilT
MERDQASKFVNDLLRLMVSRNGSDLFLTADFPPAIKVDGKVTKVAAAADRPAHAAAGALGDERQAGGRVRAHQGMQLRDLAAGHGALPRQRLRAAGPRGPGDAHHPADAAHHRRLGLPRC